MNDTAIFIPARYGSTRYPGKPLVLLDGKPMIQRVAEVCLSTGYDTYVLTDNKTIAMAAKSAGADFFIDTEDYDNGTERCAGAIRSRKFDQYSKFINVQGDMPDVTKEIIDKAIQGLEYCQVTTVYTSMPEELQQDPNSVKLIQAGDRCLWFGRGITGYGEWHLGVYGYTKQALDSYLHLNVHKEERIERLEQLRWLKNSWQIGCYKVQFNGTEINTPEDVEEWQKKN